MNWKEFQDKYAFVAEDYNAMPYMERVRIGNFCNAEAIRELDREKAALKEDYEKQIDRINKRILSFEKSINENLKILSNHTH